MARLAHTRLAATLSALLLLAGIGPALGDDRAAAAARYAVVVEDCAGTAADFLPTVRRGGRILIDGIAVTGRGDRGQVVLVAEQVRRQCASALRYVEIVVETP
jgi:hypothetical protein